MSMVIGGKDGYDGLFRVAVKLVGQSADVVSAAGLVFPDPPAVGGRVVVVVVVDGFRAEACFFDFELPLVSATEIPTTTAATMTRVIPRLARLTAGLLSLTFRG
ncbi:MAG: hypothetical protein ACYCV5_03360 [Acidimicrobiales bacterium]